MRGQHPGIKRTPRAPQAVLPFTSSGTWYKRANLLYIRVILQAAGGSSSAGGGYNQHSHAGGAGGYSEKIIMAKDLAMQEMVTVGAAPGGASSFGAHCTATGGGSGSSGSNGGGGSASGGDLNLGGEGGTLGNSHPTQGMSIGGRAVMGAYGSGGSAYLIASAFQSASGNQGVVIVEEYYAP